MVSNILSFNGLYGQDAYEYLRQSEAIFDRMRGLNVEGPGLGDTQFAVGFPLAGAILQWLVPNAPLALQWVSWLSAGLAVLFFYQNLRLLSPGAHEKSRAVFTGLALILAPYFVRAGWTSMSDALGLALTLGALYWGLQVVYKGRTNAAMGAALLMSFAITTRFATIVLFFPLVVAMLYVLWKAGNKAGILMMIWAGLLALLPIFWLKNGVVIALDRHWSVWHFFQRTFVTENGTFHYTLPNILYLFFPLAHPGFCLLMPGLLLLAKKTDVVLRSKKVLIACLIAYLLLLGGLPHQNLRFLLPAYAILLLLFFPAWDRMFAYGFYFFKRLTWTVLVGVLLIQVISMFYILKPVLQRNRLETRIASEIRPLVPPKSTVFAFDLDVALRSCLPELQWKNMWIERYDSFPENSYVLFNEPLLRPQWEGKNPIFNWDKMNEGHHLELLQEMPGGWKLYRMMNDE